MADAGGQSRFGEKPAALLTGGAASRGKELHSHVAPEADMPGPVDDSHPAATELGEQLIGPEHTRQRGGWIGLFGRRQVAKEDDVAVILGEVFEGHGEAHLLPAADGMLAR